MHSDFDPTVLVLVVIVAAFLIAFAFAMRKFTIAVVGVEPGDDLPLHDSTHTTPFE